MPNHVKSRMQINGTPEQIEQMLKEFGTSFPAKLSLTHDGELIICKQKDAKDWSCGWFNAKTGIFEYNDKKKVTGLPDGWQFEIEQGYIQFPDFAKVVPPPNDPAYRDEPNQEIAKKSPNWWYDWNCNNWGTKWNSYSCEKEGWNIFTFETAWSAVPEIIEKISKKYPDVEITYEYADEDTGHNVGSYRFLDGIVNVYEPEGGSKEAYELAFKLRPSHKEGYVLEGEKYVYHDEEAGLTNE